jgi:hypothetical protein
VGNRILNSQLNPELGKLSLGEVKVRYSRHAIEQAERKHIVLPAQGVLVVPEGSIVELELDIRTERPVKAVVRNQYNSDWDLVSVIIPSSYGLFLVKTVWLNSVTDQHQTLNKKRLKV